MKITDLKDKLPIKVKLNSNFTLEESFDTNTIILVKGMVLDSDVCGNCYKVYVSALKEDLEYNKSIAIHDWRNPYNNKYELSYYEVNKPNDIGNYEDTIFVMEDDDCFDLIEDKQFPNGLDYYLETYYNIVAELSWMEAECTTFKSKLVDEIHESKGRKGLVELAQDLTMKFEQQYAPTWFEIYDFYETIDKFLEEELYEKA